MLPFIAPEVKDWNIQPGDRLYIPGIRALLEGGGGEDCRHPYPGTAEPDPGDPHPLPGLTREERDIVLAGCLINYYAR